MSQPLQRELKKRLPKPANGLVVVLGEAPEREKIPGRVYIDKNGVEHPWMYEGNRALWLGQNEDED